MSDLHGKIRESLQLRAFGALDLTGLDSAVAAAVLAQPKRLVLLIYLAMAPSPHFRRRDTLVALFWPELDESHARGALRQALRFLRQALGADALVVRGIEEVGVARTVVRFDVHAFENAVAVGDRQLALSLYAGDLLDGVHVSGVAEELEHWIAGERSRLRAMACDCARALALDARALRDAASSARWSQHAYTLSGHDERDLVHLLTALAESGERSGALRLYAEYAHELQTAIGAEPSPHVRALVDRIQHGALTTLSPVIHLLPAASEELAPRAVTVDATPTPGDTQSNVSTPAVLEAQSVHPVFARASASSWPVRSRRSLATMLGVLLLAGTGLFVRLDASRVPSSSRPANGAGAAAPSSSDNPVATQAFVRGQYLLGKRDTGSIRMARDEFLRAIDADASFAEAWVGLSYAYGTFAHYGMMSSTEALARAETAARKALLLRPSAGMARVVLAGIVAFQQWRWDDGVRGMREGIAMDSLNADAHNVLGILLRVQGRFDEALVEARRAAQLDPLGRHYEYQIGHILLCAGRYPEALETARKALSLGGAPYPGGHFIAAEALFGLGRFRESLVERATALGDARAARHALDMTDAQARATLDSMQLYDAAVQVRRLEEIPPTQFVSPVDRATAYAGVRNFDEAFRWLYEAQRVRDVNLSKIVCNDLFDPVLGDSRWVKLMRDINLPADVRHVR